MGNCSCSYHEKCDKKDSPEERKEIYICPQCSTFTATPSGAPAPECCGKKMQVLD
jgi:hypothetical protein